MRVYQFTEQPYFPAWTDHDGSLRVNLPNARQDPAVAADLRQLGITSPGELSGRDPYALYDDLCRITGHRHDPCLLDTFIAAIRYMEGGPKKPWWKYTAERKRELEARKDGSQ